jgi:hypothetical protein
MQYLDGVYKTVTQQAVMSALNREQWNMEIKADILIPP